MGATGNEIDKRGLVGIIQLDTQALINKTSKIMVLDKGLIKIS
jgi:hypothetical protein